MVYYSEQINGKSIRNIDIISHKVWKSIISNIDTYISNNYFAHFFPGKCPDNEMVFSTNIKSRIIQLF